jgi:Tol biopolymer transport system component
MSQRHQGARNAGRVLPAVISAIGALSLFTFHGHAMVVADITTTTDRISSDSSGVQGNADSTGVSISTDGRFVAFVSWSTNLVAGDTNSVGDIFVKDRQTGATVRASVSSAGAQSNGESYEPALSADGRYVAFTSDASNLVPGDNNNACDIFVHDLTTGSTIRASVSSAGQEADAASNSAAISSDGRYLAFESRATNLVAADTNQRCDVFLRDLQTGTTERISVSASGAQSDGISQNATLSDDGRYVAFASTATNLCGSSGTNNIWNVFVRDRTAGQVNRISVSSTGSDPDGASLAPSMSPDGHFLAFESRASNLVAGDTNNRSDVFVRDIVAGTTTRVSVGCTSEQANGGSTHASISADGRFVAFMSEASNLVVGDTNGAMDVFVFDRQSGTTSRASVGSTGAQVNGASSWPAVSRSGQYVVFPSGGAQFVSGDTNGADDVFVRGPLF